MSLEDRRKQIDAIDDQLVELLEQRAKVALEVAHEKAKLGWSGRYDPEREQVVVGRIVARHQGVLPRAALHAVYREIIAACRSVQEPLRVAFLGPEGTYSHGVARALFGATGAFVATGTIEGVFGAVSRGEAVRGVVPRENSTEGVVADTVRALLEHDVKIEREVVVRVSHCLLSKSGDLSRVKRVHSHPQALGQCARWLSERLPGVPLVAEDSTAEAARVASGDDEAAALAGRQAAERYGLEVVASAVEDERDNATRFIVIGEADGKRTGQDRTSLAFEVPDRPGALREALSAFDEAGVNLGKIESFPSRGRPWSYVFLCEMDGHRDDPPVARALEALSARAASVKMLGSYPKATTISPG